MNAGTPYHGGVSLLYCGIDEAGYGPMLGPMCVSAALFEVDHWNEGQGPPNLWDRLQRAVCRSPKGAGSRIPIADSKKLKLPNNSARDPLIHLERGVLSFHEAWLGSVQSDAILFKLLRARLGDEPWYSGAPVPLPRSGTREQIRIDANMLSREGTAAGVRLLALWCLALPEGPFNELIRKHGSKAATTTLAMRTLISRVLRDFDKPHVRIVCDRQGGRVRYGAALSNIAGRDRVEILEESNRVSRYELSRGVRVLLVPEAEQAHLPVALASMTAKLVRELAMARFNRYWCSQLPGLRATAGYTQDARRWLEDAHPVIDERVRATLVRLA